MGVLLLDPAGQIDRTRLGGFGPSHCSLDLGLELHAPGVAQFDLRGELRRLGLGPFDLRLERVGARGGGLQRRPDRDELVPRLGELRVAIPQLILR